MRATVEGRDAPHQEDRYDRPHPEEPPKAGVSKERSFTRHSPFVLALMRVTGRWRRSASRSSVATAAPAAAKNTSGRTSPARHYRRGTQPTLRRPAGQLRPLRRTGGAVLKKVLARARGQSAERRRCGCRTFKTCHDAARRDAMTRRPAPCAQGARLSALHRGIYRTPARACVLQDCPGVVHRETRASALSGRGASRVRPSARLQSLARGEPLPPPSSVCLRTTPS